MKPTISRSPCSSWYIEKSRSSSLSESGYVCILVVSSIPSTLSVRDLYSKWYPTLNVSVSSLGEAYHPDDSVILLAKADARRSYLATHFETTSQRVTRSGHRAPAPTAPLSGEPWLDVTARRQDVFQHFVGDFTHGFSVILAQTPSYWYKGKAERAWVRCCAYEILTCCILIADLRLIVDYQT